LQQNTERHFLSFHSPFIRFLPPFATTGTTSVLRFAFQDERRFVPRRTLARLVHTIAFIRRPYPVQGAGSLPSANSLGV